MKFFEYVIPSPDRSFSEQVDRPVRIVSKRTTFLVFFSGASVLFEGTENGCIERREGRKENSKTVEYSSEGISLRHKVPHRLAILFSVDVFVVVDEFAHHPRRQD